MVDCQLAEEGLASYARATMKITTTMTAGLVGMMVLAACGDDSTTPCSFGDMVQNQVLAVRCYFGDSSVPQCLPGATLWTSLFTITYVLGFSVGAVPPPYSL